MRLGELRALQWEDVDEKTGSIRIRRDKAGDGRWLAMNSVVREALHTVRRERKILGPNHLFLLRTGQKHEAIVRRRRLGSLALLGRAGRKGQQRRKRQPEDCSTPVAVTVQPIIARHVARSFHYSVYYSVPLTFAIRRNDTIASSSVPWM